MRYAALLRDINVGGNKKVAMAELRALLTGLGYADVTTYLQSGNAVFSSPEQPAGAVGSAIEAAIAADLGTGVRVVIRTGAEIAAAIERCPLPGAPQNPSRFFVVFLSAEPDPALAREIQQQSFGPDQIWVRGSEAFLWCPNGAAETKLTNNLIEKRLGVTATSRNWNTVNKLASLAAP